MKKARKINSSMQRKLFLKMQKHWHDNIQSQYWAEMYSLANKTFLGTKPFLFQTSEVKLDLAFIKWLQANFWLVFYLLINIISPLIEKSNQIKSLIFIQRMVALRSTCFLFPFLLYLRFKELPNDHCYT